MAALLVAIVFVVCGSTSPGVICTCVPGPALTSRSLVREAAARYHTVLEGTIVNVEIIRPSRDTADPGFPLGELAATIRVARSWRGSRSDTIVIRTALFTTACGLGFRTGDHYLLFADEVDGKLYASTCGPSRTWDTEAERLARALGRAHVAPAPGHTEASLLGSWQLRLWVIGPAAESAGPREVSGPIQLRRASTGPVPRGLQWVYSVTYDSTLYAMLGAPRAGPAQAVLSPPDSIKLTFNPFVDHGAFRLTGLARGDSITGDWQRTNFADDGYRGAFTMVRRRQP